jgi:hypothetical protein
MDKTIGNGARTAFPALASLLFLLGSLFLTALQADETTDEDTEADPEQLLEDERATSRPVAPGSIGVNVGDPHYLLAQIQNDRKVQRDALFGKSPIGSLHDAAKQWSKDFYDKTNIQVGTSIHHLFTWLTNEIPGEDDWGTATDADIIFRWDVLNRGQPNVSSITLHLENRWDWGTSGPMNIATASLGQLASVGNTFDKYVPVTIIRNLYWQTGGGPKSKGTFRIGKMTPDSIYGVTPHLTPNNACLSYTCTGAFTIGVPDSGLGFAGAWHINDRFKIVGGINDANADRYDWGDIGEGDFFKVIDFNVKIWPVTEKAGYSRFTLWQVDENGGSNGALGPKGWGYNILLEQELSSDGSLVGIAKYGRSMKESAFYKRQGVLALVKYEPDWFTGINNDSVGASYSVMKANVAGAQTEKNLELWYKFPLTPNLQTSLHYQGIFNASLRYDRDYASAWSIRFTTAF